MSISVGGLISGLDTNSMINQMLEIQQRPIAILQNREAAYQVELTAYGNLKSALSGLKTALEGLDSTSELTRFSAASADPDLFTASAGETAAAGTYDIRVQQLATVHKLTSGAFSENEPVGEGILHLRLGDGATADIAVAAGDTIQDVAQAINDADAGVRAAVVFDGTNYFLTLAGRETGAQNVIRLTATDTGDGNDTDASGLSRLVYDQGVTENLSNTQAAADAIISVDGVTDIHRGGNSFDDVIQGVTLNLLSAPAAPGNEATLTVSRDTAAVTAKIETFVDAYNKAVEAIDSAQAYDAETGQAGVLMGDATTNGIRRRLADEIAGTVSGVEPFSRLTDLGISLDSQGRLKIDNSVLDDALDNHFEDVLKFFAQPAVGTEGFAGRLIDTLDRVLDSRDGALTVRTDGIQSSIEDIAEQIERMELRNQAWETRTRAQFNALETLLAEYQTTGDYLTQQIAGLQNLNNFISNR